MTDAQWETLRKIIKGEKVDPAPVGFIIDCPWLPNWYGTRIVDYFSNDSVWLAANLKAVKDFPDVMFLPGFWSEYGMCTEPSAFGARCAFPANEFPHAHKVIASMDDIDSLVDPDPRTDGLLPFVLNRLVMAKGPMADAGHQVRIAVARGPLNIASYLMGSTEFLTTMMMFPEKAHALLDKICAFLVNWIDLQRKTFPATGGLLLLDDIIGFLGEAEFLEFAMPCFQKLYTKDLEVRFLHNDAPCKVSAPFLTKMGVNLYNPGIDVSLPELRALAGPELTILGNLPPRDILAAGTPETVEKETRAMVASLADRGRIIYSAGGGMPPAVSTANIQAFIKAVRTTA